MELVHTPANGGVAPAPATEREPKRARLEDGGALTISPRFTAESGALRLVQAHPKLLEALRRGDEVRFVGPRGDGTVVLATADATFEVLKAESSNVMLLAAPPGARGAPGTF